jgi:radical SAM protein with 4Fe4S-binding SPASM domain
MIHVAANGDIFPCGSSSWVVEKNESFKLGNIKDKIALAEWKSRLFELHKKSPKYESECAVCNAAQICSFGCSAFEKVDKGGFANICEATKLFYNLLKTFNAESLLELLKSEQA